MAKKSQHGKQAKPSSTAGAPSAAAVSWSNDPAEHDYPAAASFLRSNAPDSLVEGCVALLSPTVQ